MEAQSRYPDARYALPGTDMRRGPSLGTYHGQPRSSLPPGQSLDLSTNEVARTASKRRKPSGNGSGNARVEELTSPPAAPEVPKAPPFAFRPPNTNGHLPSDSIHPPSFAERARILTGNPSPQDTINDDRERKNQPPKPKTERRASLNRPIGGLYTEIQQHKRDSYPSTASGPTSPRRFSVPSNTQPHPSEPTFTRRSPEERSSAVQKGIEVLPPSIQPVARRSSATQPPKQEWASDRSPLQVLEAKLEKRARVEQAESKLRSLKAEHLRDKRNIGLTADPASSSRVPADSEAPNPKRTSDYFSQSLADRGTTGLGIRDTRGGHLTEGHISLPYANSRVQQPPTDIGSKATQENDLRLSAKTSRKPSEPRRASQQQDRAVRFQAEDHSAFDRRDSEHTGGLDSQHRNRTSKALDIDPASAEARAARREQLRQPPRQMVNGRQLEDVTPQRQTLCGPDAEQSQSLAISKGETTGLVPGKVDKMLGHVTKRGILPQTASGAQARQRAGSGGHLESTGDVPAQRSHHLSNLLHRGYEHSAHIHEKSVGRPQTLDEWRHGGVARLAAVDFSEETATTDDQTWREDSGSGRRRRSQRAKRGVEANVQMNGDDHEQSTGKKTFRHVQARNIEEPQFSEMRWTNSHARPYVSIDDSLGVKKSLLSRFKANKEMFISSRKSDKNTVLSSYYSYSCPNLADHDPAHASHICEPYLSPELIQSMRSIRIRPVPGVQTFSPPLYLKCGPLLRYTGLKRDKLEFGPHAERETWRGSVMIVTTDVDSTYEPVPTLRLFPEPMELLPPPPQKVETEDRNGLPSEILDPIAGLPKLNRTGKTVYVKPADDLGKNQDSRDLSLIEDDDGLFEETRTAAVPTSYGTPDFHHVRNGPQPKTPFKRTNAKKGRQVQGFRLHAERGVTFWRFNLEVELGHQQARIAYSINNGPAVGFWVPARGHSMNCMFHSCNGFSMSVNPDDFSGPDPLWRDVLNSHQVRPFHVMIGGGDQIYNDAVMKQSPLFSEWLEIKNPHHKFEAEFSDAMQEELETFYLERYAMWFSQGLFGMANSQIPMVNMWDDHDIIDGFGSYPHDFMSTPVFCGLGAVAYKYYMLFQHQTVREETSTNEPSWLMGAAPGPYISELGRSVFVSLGKNVAFLGVDCRTERQWDEVVSEASYDLIFDRCRREIIEGETRHLVVLLGIPIAYPRLVWLENLLTSRVMDPIKALGKAGVMGNFLNKFNGGVEILDDLDDHWTAKHHKQERNWFIQELQELAAEKSVRVTILGGDVHLAAVGQFYSNPKLAIPKDQDHRYMANIISSAIVNTPPPEMMGDILNKRNKVHHLDHETDEDMIPMFTHDVDGKIRNNKRLLPRRNWCSIREYHPGSTPPPTPSSASSERQSLSDREYSPPPPPTRLQRTMSLTRGEIKPGNIFRRLSGRGLPPASYLPNEDDGHDDPISSSSPDDHSLTQSALLRSSTTPSNEHGAQQYSSAPLPRPGFHRRPTNMSEKAAVKGDVDPTTGHINLEHGLDIVLNCEVNQRDPAGITTPYRLLIPALWYQGSGDRNTTPLRKVSVLKRLASLNGRRASHLAGGQGRGNWGGKDSQSGSEVSGSDGESPEEENERRPRRWSFGLTQRRQYRDQTPPSLRESREDNRSEGPNFQQAMFSERPQHQRQFEDRNQQIGPHNATKAGTQQQAFDRLTGQRQQKPTNEQMDGPEDVHRDSVDYHEHLDTVRSQSDAGNMGRRLSKVNRMLGVGGGRQSSGNTVAGRGFVKNQKNDHSPTLYDDEDYDPPPTQSATLSQGDGSFESYPNGNEKRKSWKRFLP